MNKTPRQILLESHSAAAPQLDRLREEVLVAEFGTANRATTFPAAILQKLWLELIWPSRRAWAGLAAAWVMLAAVYLSTQRPGDDKAQPMNPEIIAAWMQQQQLLAALLDHPRSLSLPKDLPAPLLPAPARGGPARGEPVEPVEGARPEPVEGAAKSAQSPADEPSAWV
jgi:hypothetical protein